jgi:hypothetical protein
LETGWVGIDDPKTRAELQEKMKKEDPKSVPPPQMAPQNSAALQAGSSAPAPATAPVKPSSTNVATPAPSDDAGPATSVADPKGKGKGNDKRSGKDSQLSVESAPLRDMTPVPAVVPVPRKDPNKGNRVRETDPFTTDSAPDPAPGSEAKPSKNKDRRGGAEVPSVQQPADAGVLPPGQAVPQEKPHGGGKPKKDEMKAAPPVAPPRTGAAPEQGKGKPEKDEKKDEGKGKPPKGKH